MPPYGRSSLALLLCALAVGCAGPTAEERIHSLVAAAESALEERRLAGLADLLAEDYEDAAGRDKRAVLQVAGAYLAQSGPIFVLTHVDEIRLADADRASAALRAAVAAVPLESLADLSRVRADLFRVELRLVRIDGEWKVGASDWRDVGLDGFL